MVTMNAWVMPMASDSKNREKIESTRRSEDNTESQSMMPSRRTFMQGAGTAAGLLGLAGSSEASQQTGGAQAEEQSDADNGDDIPPRMFADMVVVNGKIATLDNKEINTNPGTIVEAMAVRGDKVLDVGKTNRIRMWAGPETQVVDLDGDTVIPGIIDAHSHLHLHAQRKIAPEQFPEVRERFDKHQVTVTEGETIDELVDNWERKIEEKAHELEPGTWILASTSRDLGDLAIEALQNERLDIDRLDQLAPDHPITANSHPIYFTNSAGIDWWEDFAGTSLPNDIIDPETGRVIVGTDFARGLRTIVVLQNDIPLLSEVVLEGMNVYAGNGITTFASHLYPTAFVGAYNRLDQEGNMPIRFGYGHRAGNLLNPNAPKFYARFGDLAGNGTDYYWNIGVTPGGADSGPPEVCLSEELAQEVEGGDFCQRIEPGARRYNVIKEAAKGGMRYATNHTMGDLAADHSIQALVEGSKEAGMSEGDIRAKRHAMDHSALYPLPRHVETFNRYNIRPAMNIREGWRHLSMFEEGGENIQEVMSYLVPAKTALDGGIRAAFHGRELESPFDHLEALVTRKWDGDDIAPEQAIDRVLALKMATVFNSEYVLREDLLGSLEPGKFADFVVLNQDYFNVSDSSIGDISPKLTVVGGEIVHTDGRC